MRKNAFKEIDYNTVYQHFTPFLNKLESVLSKDNLDFIAYSTGFIKRNRKVTATGFLNALTLDNEDQSDASLVDISCDLFDHSSIDISKVGVHNRFNECAVSFFKKVLSQMIEPFLCASFDDNKAGFHFSAVNIKDSTKFKLPDVYAGIFPSYGSYGKQGALMNVQYEYDLLSGDWKSLKFTQATRNDQQDSKETANNIQPESLNIRDLGYVTLPYLKGVVSNEAFFLNRLPKMNAYVLNDKGKYILLDWKKIDNKMKKHKLGQLELEVFLGKKEKIKSRLIIAPVSQSISDDRLMKAGKGGQRNKGGYQLSKEYRLKSHYNIFITNVPKEILPISEVIKIYSLRWQIELVFKAWKSNLHFDKVKAVKKERLECQLLARVIWILMGSWILQASNSLLGLLKENATCCSLTKFFKRAKKFPRLAIVGNTDGLTEFLKWYQKKFVPLLPKLELEVRLGKPSHFQLIKQLAIC